MNMEFFGMEEFDEDKKSQIEENASDGDTDSKAVEALNAINSLEYLDCFSKLQEQNSDMKIRMLRKIGANVAMCKGTEQFASLESYIQEQALESAATSEANGGKHEATGDNLDKNKLGEKKKNFFKTVWQAIKDAFIKVVGWIREKITKFASWIRSLFQKNKLDQIKNLEPKEYDALAAAISKFEFEDQSEDGAIPLYNKAADNLLGKTNTYFTLCKHLDAMIKQMVNTGMKPEGFTSNINQIIDALKEIPGIGNIPTISSASKENIETFNREFKTAISNLKFAHDPVGYTKYYTGQQLVERKDKLTCKTYFNTFDPDAIVGICNNTVDCLNKVNDMVSASEKYVKEFDKIFMDFLNKNNYTDRNGNVTVSDNIPEDKKGTADLNYQFIGSCLSLFKAVQAISKIIADISSRLMTSAKNGAQAILKSKSRAIDAVEGNHMISGGQRTAHDKDKYNKIHDKLDKSLTGGTKRYDDDETKTIKDKVTGAAKNIKKAAKKIW